MLQEQFVVEGFFRRQDVSPKDRGRVFAIALALDIHNIGFALGGFQALLLHLLELHSVAKRGDFSALGCEPFSSSRTCTNACFAYGVCMHASDLGVGFTCVWKEG
jgi:hypothetical protein